ncbi:MAG: hypothetical protein ACFCUX_07390 [Candidatus Methylacidiphilales bacterium]
MLGNQQPYSSRQAAKGSNSPPPQDPPHQPAAKSMNPAYSPTCIIDLKKVVHSIHESKGQVVLDEKTDQWDNARHLLDVIVDEAQSLRETGASPESIMPILMSRLGYSETTLLGSVAAEISRMAGDLTDQPTYHNPQHITEVILAAFSLGLREHLPPDRMGELMIAAAAHDLGHTGGSNETPYALETRSYELAYPVMVEKGMTEEQIDRVGQMILATDFVNGVPIVRENYLHLKSLKAKADPGAWLTARQCLILTEADILFSCFSETYNELLSNLLSLEWKKGRNMNYEERIGFLRSVRFLSDAATQLGLDERRKELIESLKHKSSLIPLPPNISAHPATS